MAYVNTICIWAISRSSQIDIVDRNAVAACNVHVEIFAIDRADLVNKSILYFAQLNGLRATWKEVTKSFQVYTFTTTCIVTFVN